MSWGIAPVLVKLHLVAAGRRDGQLRRLEAEVEGVDLERAAGGRGRAGRRMRAACAGRRLAAA